MLQSRYGWTDEHIGRIEYGAYLQKIEVVREIVDKNTAVDISNAISISYLAWTLGLSKGKSFSEHLRNMKISDMIDVGELTEKELKKRKRGALWKAKKIMGADKKRNTK